MPRFRFVLQFRPAFVHTFACCRFSSRSDQLPELDRRYAGIPKEDLPRAESLKVWKRERAGAGGGRGLAATIFYFAQ